MTTAPDFTTAAAFLGILSQPHTGQHRCTDGNYYSPSTAYTCPTNGLTDRVVGVLDDAMQEAHTAVHDPEVVDDVAAAMLSGPLADLDPEHQEAWRTLARMGLEEFCRLLDARRELVQS